MKASKFFKLKALREAAQVVIETAKETLEVAEKKLEEIEQQYSANVEAPVQEVKTTTKKKVVKDA